MSFTIPPRPARHHRRTHPRSRPPRAQVVIAALAAVLAALIVGLVPVASAVAAPPEGAGEETEELSNNLSFPVIWSDGARLELPGVFGEPQLPEEAATECKECTNPETEEVEDISPVWPQAAEGVTWQAENVFPSLMPVDVSEVDWGDSLSSRTVEPGKPVRVETTLIEKLDEPMQAFQMVSEGERQNETFYTTGKTYESDQATIYSGCARLTIQRLLISREDPYISELKWDEATGEWTGKELISPALFNGGVWAGGEGTGYSSEVNASGKVLYGYNWSTSGLEPGDYRLTFSLDPNCPAAVLNTYITEATTAAISEEEEGGEEAAASAAATSAGAVPKIDAADNLSYIDYQLGNPSYEPYVPPEPEPEEKEEVKEEVKTTTTLVIPVVTATTTASQTTAQTKEQTQSHKRVHVKVTLHKKVLKHNRKRILYRLWGTVGPRRDHQKLRIQLRTKKGWKTVAVTRLQTANKKHSKYSLKLRNPKKGTYRALMVSNNKYYAGTSGKVKLRHR